MGAVSGRVPCVFFDRDGIVNVAPTTRYVERAEDFHMYPEFLQALQVVHRRGYAAVVVTNQKGVSTGATPRPELEAMHRRLREEAALVGAPILAIYACTEPDEDHPDRKPNPGMLLRAAAEHGLDLGRSWMIGDNPKDVEAGHRAGCTTVFVGAGETRSGADYRIAHVCDLAGLLERELPALTHDVQPAEESPFAANPEAKGNPS